MVGFGLTRLESTTLKSADDGTRGRKRLMQRRTKIRTTLHVSEKKYLLLLMLLYKEIKGNIFKCDSWSLTK